MIYPQATYLLSTGYAYQVSSKSKVTGRRQLTQSTDQPSLTAELTMYTFGERISVIIK